MVAVSFSSPRSFVTAFLAVAILCVLAGGCDLADPAKTLAPEQPNMALQQQTTYWENNTLEAVDADGTTWRFERDGEMPTAALLYRNGQLQGQIRFNYDGGPVDRMTFMTVSEDWIETDPSGTILRTTEGPMCPPWDIGCIEPTSSRCDEEYHAMQSAAWDAVGVGAVAAIATTLGGPANPIAIGSIIVAGTTTGLALGRLGQWAVCRLGGGGSPHPPVEPTSMVFGATSGGVGLVSASC
jgi:hypothetical protein